MTNSNIISINDKRYDGSDLTTEQDNNNKRL